MKITKNIYQKYAKTFEPGQVLFKEGEQGDEMFIIIQGEVEIRKRTSAKTFKTLITFHEGDIFGEMALIDDLPRSATTIANTNVIIFEISRHNFLNFIKNDSESGVRILMKLARILSLRLREADNKLKAFVNLSQWI